MQPNHSLRLDFSPENERSFGPCECCGTLTRRVWGFAYEDDVALAAYFVEWTPAHQDREVVFDLIYGSCGDETSAEDRVAVSLAYRILETGPSFMVVDATTRPVGRNTLAHKALTRNELLSDAIKPAIFEICDVIYLQDPRIATLTR
jgi:hypothetical protein